MLTWVAEPAAGQAPPRVELRLYDVLFWGRKHLLNDLCHNSSCANPQGVLNWVAEPAAGQAPPRLELRLYNVLFRGQDPAGSEDWLADLNPNSLEIVSDALASPPLMAAQPGDR